MHSEDKATSTKTKKVGTKTTPKKRGSYDNSNRKPTKAEQLRINKWSSWSLAPHTPDEIRAQILKDSGCVCITYLCEHSTIPCDFLEEFLVLSTFLLDESNYEKDYEKVKNMLFSKLEIGDYIEDAEPIIINNNTVNDLLVTVDTIGDRIDWKGIGLSQRIDLYTAERFGKLLPWDLMTPKCGLSQAFIDANKYEYITKYNKLKKDIKGCKDEDETDIAKQNLDTYDEDDFDEFDDNIEVDFSNELESELSSLTD